MSSMTLTMMMTISKIYYIEQNILLMDSKKAVRNSNRFFYAKYTLFLVQFFI